jgi:hypothetical protein
MTKKMSNSALLLTATIAAQRVLRPRCLLRMSAADRNVRLSENSGQTSNGVSNGAGLPTEHMVTKATTSATCAKVLPSVTSRRASPNIKSKEQPRRRRWDRVEPTLADSTDSGPFGPRKRRLGNAHLERSERACGLILHQDLSNRVVYGPMRRDSHVRK